MPRVFRRLLVGYAVLGAALWTTPLLSILHVESSAIVATAAFFGSGWTTPSLRRNGASLRTILLYQEAALLIPWTFLTVSLIWQPNCGYFQGLLFYLSFPAVTVVFAVALHEFLAALGVDRAILIHSIAGILLLIFPPIYDIGFHPQFYTYNHVFGGFLGPIYDEQLSIRPGLFAFRTLTILWSLFFFCVSAFLVKKAPAAPAGLAAVAILACYVWAPELGINTTHEVIEKRLGAVRYSEHFEIYYDPAVVSTVEIEEMVVDHEFRYAQLVRKLNTTVDARIRSYIYPDPDTKGLLTGARHTNVAPVWLDHPQAHVLYAAYDHVFPHELVHVFSREFGLPIVRASVSIGLVEGLAVAFEPPSGAPSADELVSAAILSEGSEALSALTRSSDLSESIASRLSPFGFWTGRGAVSYTAMGSFTGFLVEKYGIERFKRAYAWAEFEDVYGKPADVLASEWIAYVLSLRAVSRSAQDVVTARFRVPSLFEKECPHYVPQHRRKLAASESALIRGDTLRALALAEEALKAQPEYLPALELWAGLSIATGEAKSVSARLERTDTLTASLRIRFGDAYALLGKADTARAHYVLAREQLPAYAYEARSLVQLRAASADDLAVMRGYLTGSSAIDTASSPAGRMLGALQAAQHKRFELAFDLLRRTSTDELPHAAPLGEDLWRHRLAWLARFAYRSGSLTNARVFADSAAAAYRTVGAFNKAAALQDLRARIDWLTSTELERVAEDAVLPSAAFRGRRRRE